MIYYLYIVKCVDETFYTGITLDIKRRVSEHNTSKVGAKYTRSRRPVKLVYSKKYRSHKLAAKAELKVKRLSRPAKLKLIKK